MLVADVNVALHRCGIGEKRVVFVLMAPSASLNAAGLRLVGHTFTSRKLPPGAPNNLEHKSVSPNDSIVARYRL
jgi:hypothetical protein